MPGAEGSVLPIKIAILQRGSPAPEAHHGRNAIGFVAARLIIELDGPTQFSVGLDDSRKHGVGYTIRSCQGASPSPHDVRELHHDTHQPPPVA